MRVGRDLAYQTRTAILYSPINRSTSTFVSTRSDSKLVMRINFGDLKGSKAVLRCTSQ